MKFKSICTDTPEDVFRHNVCGGIFFGPFALLSAMQTSYSSESHNEAKWKGTWIGLLCNVAVLLLRRGITVATVYAYGLFASEAGGMTPGTVVSIVSYIVAAFIVFFLVRFVFKILGLR